MSDTKTSEKAERPLKRMPSPFLLYSNRTTTTYSKTLKPPIFFWTHKFCVIFSLIPNFLKVQIWSLKLKKGTVWSLFFFFLCDLILRYPIFRIKLNQYILLTKIKPKIKVKLTLLWMDEIVIF